VRLWPFIEAEQAEQHNVARACVLLEVSRAAFYEYRKHQPSDRDLTDAELTAKITEIHETSAGTYGAPRVHRELRDRGVHVGKKRVARLMVQAGLVGRCKRRWTRTTIADPDADMDRAVDLIQRAFGPCTRLDERWCGDITYIATWDGWAYLATVIDLGSRRVVGWALADHMRTDLVVAALEMACHQRRPSPGVIFHSDRGSQYTSHEFARVAGEFGATLSFGRKGQCWDNAVAESFFATIKGELIDTRPWPTLAGLRRAVFDYIEGWYNTRRLHSSLSYQSPARYEHQLRQDTAATAA
jgi:transposase InsO family protein